MRTPLGIRSAADSFMKSAHFRANHLERMATVRNVFSRGNQIDANIDQPRLTTKGMVILVNADGTWKFTPGYSVPGNGDVIP